MIIIVDNTGAGHPISPSVLAAVLLKQMNGTFVITDEMIAEVVKGHEIQIIPLQGKEHAAVLRGI